MTPERRRTVLFLLCAAVLLAAGYSWGYSRTYDGFYSPDASLNRELVNMNFNSRVLHHVNTRAVDESRRELTTQLRRQAAYVGGLLGTASPDARREGEAAVRQAERALAGQPLNAVATVSPEGR